MNTFRVTDRVVGAGPSVDRCSVASDMHRAAWTVGDKVTDSLNFFFGGVTTSRDVKSQKRCGQPRRQTVGSDCLKDGALQLSMCSLQTEPSLQ